MGILSIFVRIKQKYSNTRIYVFLFTLPACAYFFSSKQQKKYLSII